MHPPAPAPEGRHAGLGQTVLLVEDEADILLILSATLSRAGYAPTSASSVSAAVQAWQSAEPPFDAAIVDMVLPDGSGLDFLNAVSPTGSTRFIFVSGYLEDTRDFDAVRERGYHFVHKPYSIDIMTDLLRRALEENGQDK